MPLPTLTTAAVLAAAAVLTVAAPPSAQALEAEIDQLLAVGPEGKGNPEAAAAWKSIAAQATPADVPALLAAMDKAGPLAANWIRGAVLTVADRSQAAGSPLTPDSLTAFLTKTTHGPAGRLLAADLLKHSHPDTWKTLVPTFLLDPVPALRREPVALLTTSATAAKDKSQLRQALDAARDEDQVRAAADELRTLGETVDLPRHFGFLMDWQVIGPFDNKSRSGYAAVFPPELSIDLNASYQGKEVKPGADPTIRWKPFTTEDEFGVVDLNKPLGMLKEVTGYATTTYTSPEARPAEIRLGSKNAWKLWFNGTPVFARDEYHRGMKIDQYRFPVELKAGPNTILMKLCQNEQTETWTVQWDFQLRICDASGTALLASDRPATPPAALTGKK
ncbi:MAG: hypothetical protein JWL81_3384 [Verrucomicrobiales bacterium]|nr:hypothetical protein [Verrucomicrobiales bacterium]